ncbi:MAG: UDP-N-acetylglucosamine 2-epimerase (non-hydrolyzing) [Tannerellaceae bacterium]|jgi:UDP-N-acetylglucosamine 2-epimerase (non-hydrolysing)|nr:UDP-N-acetylglucosamine 2-epimerase (non-hydrolyzing) [Tannerellaceae bacterium]
MVKLLFVFGTRPEAIKMAPLVREFKAQADDFSAEVCVTGQHREMLDQALALFDIQPDYDLDIMKKEQDLYDITAAVLLGMRGVLTRALPDIVFVHGDTATSMATALAAYYRQIPVAHVEAGLRTYNPYNPWPEEINRQLTGRIAALHFSPTKEAKKNLLSEGIPADAVFVTGNTVVDALMWSLRKVREDADVGQGIVAALGERGLSGGLLQAWRRGERRLLLITGHRRENFGEGFLHICEAIRELAQKHADYDFVYPVHLNPNVQRPVNEMLGRGDLPNVFLIYPLDYLPFVYLMDASTLILTDSGGVQEEAPGLGKPVLVMRETTERPEALAAGTVVLVGTDRRKIVEKANALMEDPALYHAMSHAVNPYGDGHASERIVAIIKSKFYHERTA